MIHKFFCDFLTELCSTESYKYRIFISFSSPDQKHIPTDYWGTNTTTIPQHLNNLPTQLNHHQISQLSPITPQHNHQNSMPSIISNNNNNNVNPKVQVQPVHSVNHYQSNSTTDGGLSSSDTEDKDKFKCLYLLVETAVAVRQREKEQNDTHL